MSAFMVDKVHIDVMLKAGLQVGPVYRPRWDGDVESSDKLDHASVDEIGQALVLENVRSIRYRYPDTIEDPSGTPGPIDQYWEELYRYRDPGFLVSAPEALSAISCYEYQACEHPEWKSSAAAAFCDQLRHSIIATMPGYDAAPWGWTDALVAKKRGRVVA